MSFLAGRQGCRRRSGAHAVEQIHGGQLGIVGHVIDVVAGARGAADLRIRLGRAFVEREQAVEGLGADDAIGAEATAGLDGFPLITASVSLSITPVSLMCRPAV